MMNRYIEHSQVVTTNKYNTITDFHTTKHSTPELLSELTLLFVTALNNGYSFTMFSSSVSCQRILIHKLKQSLSKYNCTSTTAHIATSNHTLSFHRPTSDSSSTSNFPWASPTENRQLHCTNLWTIRSLLHSLGTDLAQKTQVPYWYVAQTA
jgi:hypothetical protein